MDKPRSLILLLTRSSSKAPFNTGVAGWAEYDIHSLQQMAGRAGRPGFDTEGKVIILTQEQNVHKYRNMLSQTFTLESRLPGNLTEHLNSGGHASDACC